MLSLVIVDDEDLIRQGLESLPWEKINIRVAGSSGSVEQALPLIRAEKPQIVLTDIRMKTMSGLDLAGILKTEFPRTKVILITGYRQFDYAMEAIRLGVFGFIVKPTSPEEILETVDKARKAILYEYSGSPDSNEDQPQDLRIKKSVRDAVAFINENYAQDLNLAVIAEHVHVAPAYLSRMFRESLDATVIGVITRVRMQKACELLRDPDLTVSEIALQVGIDDPRYFSQVFRKAYDMTPKEMRTTLSGMK